MDAPALKFDQIFSWNGANILYRGPKSQAAMEYWNILYLFVFCVSGVEVGI